MRERAGRDESCVARLRPANALAAQTLPLAWVRALTSQGVAAGTAGGATRHHQHPYRHRRSGKAWAHRQAVPSNKHRSSAVCSCFVPASHRTPQPSSAPAIPAHVRCAQGRNHLKCGWFQRTPVLPRGGSWQTRPTSLQELPLAADTPKSGCPRQDKIRDLPTHRCQDNNCCCDGTSLDASPCRMPPVHAPPAYIVLLQVPHLPSLHAACPWCMQVHACTRQQQHASAPYIYPPTTTLVPNRMQMPGPTSTCPHTACLALPIIEPWPPPVPPPPPPALLPPHPPLLAG